MALSEAQRRANDKYIKEHYRQVKLSMPNEEADLLEEYCKTCKYSKAGFIRQAIKEKIARDIDLGKLPNQTSQALYNMLGVEHPEDQAGGGFGNPEGHNYE